MRSSNNLEKISSDTYGRVQLVCMKIQVHSSLEPTLEYNQDQIPLIITVSYDLFNQLRSYRNVMKFQISSRREKQVKRYLSHQDYCPWQICWQTILLHLMQKTTSPGHGIANLPLLGTILATGKK